MSSWSFIGGKLNGPDYTPSTRPRTPRELLARAEFRVDVATGSAMIAFQLPEPVTNPCAYTIEVRQGCRVCACYPVVGADACWLYAEVCACCLPRDVYTVVLVDPECQDCANAYLDTMKHGGYAFAPDACACGSTK